MPRATRPLEGTPPPPTPMTTFPIPPSPLDAWLRTPTLDVQTRAFCHEVARLDHLLNGTTQMLQQAQERVTALEATLAALEASRDAPRHEEHADGTAGT